MRLFYWQVIRYDNLAAMAEGQHLRNYSLDAPRGTIYSSDGAVLASDKPSFSLFGQPKLIKDKENIALKLAKILAGKDYFSLKKELNQKLSQDLFWVSLVKNLDYQTKTLIDKENLVGLGFDSERARYYPESSSAAHILGFVGSDVVGNRTGYFGVEGFYNGELRGVGGELIEEKDAAGQPIIIGQFIKQEPKNGHNLKLYLDRTIQYIVEKKLKIGIEKYGAKSATAIVMDPKTGEILAMASYPNYDPNSFTDFPKVNFKNPAVADTYEPGSTFKVLTMAAAINENLIQPDTKCDACSGSVKIGQYQIRTWNNKYYPNSTMTDVIIHSDNTGMVFVGKKLGLDKLYQYIQDFGFGDLTQIDLQDETSSSLRQKKDWKEIDLATATFGQGIAVTPIQMVRAVSVIANGGLLMEPHIVQSIQNDNREIEIQPKIVRRVISEETAKKVREMMYEAVKNGEAKAFVPKGFKIAGKTGTAQISVAGHYDESKTIASFIGFAPVDNPRFIMLVTYTEPTASTFGSETAAPTFFQIAKELLAYYNIAPEEY